VSELQLELGTRLKSLRKQHDMTLQDASAKAEISLSFLSDVERNRTLPSLKTLFSLAKIYSTTASKLLEQ
jgi:XRE family transcriptional regulator, regulator of sulfur utilization